MSRIGGIFEKSLRTRSSVSVRTSSVTGAFHPPARSVRWRTIGARDTAGAPRRQPRALLDVDLTAGGLDLRLELRGLVFADAFLERLGRALDEILRLLESEARDRAHFLDHLDLLVA